MITSPFSLCVYCGSRLGDQEAYADAARLVGQWLGRHGAQLVYGGGRNGLMGVLADAALEAGAHVVGIIPKALVEKEWAHQQCSELHVVDTMHERKRLMAEHAQAFLALPGGIGTFEEFFEAWTWRQLGYHNKPVGLLNLNGYYDKLLAFMDQTRQSGFVSDWQMSLMHTSGQVTQLLETLAASAAPTPATSRLAET